MTNIKPQSKYSPNLDKITLMVFPMYIICSSVHSKDNNLHYCKELLLFILLLSSWGLQMDKKHLRNKAIKNPSIPCWYSLAKQISR